MTISEHIASLEKTYQITPKFIEDLLEELTQASFQYRYIRCHGQHKIYLYYPLPEYETVGIVGIVTLNDVFFDATIDAYPYVDKPIECERKYIRAYIAAMIPKRIKCTYVDPYEPYPE